jgi:hypothetical protein
VLPRFESPIDELLILVTHLQGFWCISDAVPDVLDQFEALWYGKLQNAAAENLLMVKTYFRVLEESSSLVGRRIGGTT